MSRTQNIHVFKPVSNRSEAHQELNAFRRKQDTALGILFKDLLLVITSDYITIFLNSDQRRFLGSVFGILRT